MQRADAFAVGQAFRMGNFDFKILEIERPKLKGGRYKFTIKPTDKAYQGRPDVVSLDGGFEMERIRPVPRLAAKGGQ